MSITLRFLSTRSPRGLIQTTEKADAKAPAFFITEDYECCFSLRDLVSRHRFLKSLTIMLAATVLAARVPACMFMIVMSAMYVRIEAESARQQSVYRFVGISRHAAI